MRASHDGWHGWAVIALATVVAVVLPGCATNRAAAGGVPVIDVWLMPNENVLVEGREVLPDRLARRLNACGAGEATLVRVHFRSGQPRASSFRLASTLESAGYRKFILVGEKQTKSSASP